MSFGFDNRDWGSGLRSGALENVVSEFKYLFHGVSGEFMMSHRLLYSTWETSVPYPKYPLVAAAVDQVMITHVIYYFSGQGTGFVCQHS